MKKLVKIVVGSVWALPFLALAQTPNLEGSYFSTLLTQAGSFLDKIVVFLIAVAVVWFVWNVIKFTMATDEDKKGEARTQMIWGIVALAVIMSIWGLVNVLQGAFGLTTVGPTGGADALNNLVP